jgi:epoxyqueuosine reductase
MQRPGSIPHEYRDVIGDRIYGCDDCQEACPISVRLGPRTTIDLTDEVAAGHLDAYIDALHLLDTDDDAIEARIGHWYIADRDLRWIRRNALVVVGNTAEPGDARARAALERYRADIDPILAEHAVWALARLDHRAAAAARGGAG